MSLGPWAVPPCALSLSVSVSDSDSSGWMNVCDSDSVSDSFSDFLASLLVWCLARLLDWSRSDTKCVSVFLFVKECRFPCDCAGSILILFLLFFLPSLLAFPCALALLLFPFAFSSGILGPSDRGSLERE